jgi:hypothetical protein
MATLRTNSRIISITDPLWEGKDFDPEDEDQLTAKRLNTYLVDCFETYDTLELRDELLLTEFRNDFIGWTEDHYKTLDKTLRTNLKYFLKDHGIYINNEGIVSQQLATLAQTKQTPEWPDKEAERHYETRGERFQSSNNPHFNKTMPVRASTPLENTPLEKNNTVKTQSSLMTPALLRSGTTPLNTTENESLDTPTYLTNAIPLPRMLTDLAKIYSNNEEKFGGELYDILDSKVQIFVDYCEKAGVPPHLYHKAYSVMLKDRAKQFYFDRLAQENLNFDEMINRTRGFFHTVEDRQMYIQEWRSTTFVRIIKAPRRRGRPPGSKNKPKPSPDTDTAMTEGISLTTAYLTAKETEDYNLAIRLRQEGKIPTAGEPFSLSDQKEVDALIGRGIFVFQKYNPEKHGNIRIFKSRMVREIKGKETDSPYEKSRLVIQGHSDQGKELVLTQSPTIQRASQRILVALAPSLIRQGMMLWIRDITQAYTQSTTALQRTILAYLPDQIRHTYPKGTIMEVVKPLYGIAEAGTHWWATYFKHHRDRLNMITSTYDPCLLITSNDSEHFAVVGMQTDDTIGLTDSGFEALEDEMIKEAKFTAKPKQKLTPANPLAFNGCILTFREDNTLALQQKKQGEKLKITTNGQEYVEQRARGAYIASICQPEAAFDLSAAAQHKEPTKEDIARMNKRIKWQMEHVDRGINYIPLNLPTVRLFVYVDASFANNKDLSSQIGYVIFLANEEREEGSFIMTGNMIHWSSTKCRRITRSVLASEIYAMVNGVDAGISFNTTINMILAKLGIPNIPMIVCTDSFSLYECLVKLGTTKEKRLMIDIMSMRQAYEKQEIFEVRWINGNDNPADAMTKSTPNQALQALIDNNTLTVGIQASVKRNRKDHN